MIFERKTKWYSQSREGYIVSAASVCGVFKFTAWPPATPRSKKPEEQLLTSTSAQECYQACRDHHAKKQAADI